jgi:hypothetical protein
MTYSEVKQLRRMAVEAGLDGAKKLQRYSIEDLKKIYNGIGSDSFPEWLRAVISYLHPTLRPVAMIHDVEWHKSDGKMATFTASNDRFKANGYKIAKYRYCFLDPRRYIVMHQARKFANVCQLFGWSAWTSPCECAICRAKRKGKAK